MRLIRNRILLKAVAVFFIIETLTSTVLPTISWALTSGPTAPEATSFEPVDTTDMVNLITGDLAYNIPFIDVPGPAGSYPLSLSYHAGIQPNEDASWVGLGWTLNPGAITRNVNGYADDLNGAKNTSRFYWEGGESRSYSVGVSVGIAGTPASVSAGLTISQDTYQGVGVGYSVGFGAGIAGNGANSLGIGATFGVSPYGDPYASVGLSASISNSEKSAVSLGLGLGISMSSSGTSAYASAGVSASYGGDKSDAAKGTMRANSNSASLLGASISTGSAGVATNVSVAGASMHKNNSAGKVSTSSNGWAVAIPVFYGISINLGYNHQRYWIDQTENVNAHGSLYYLADNEGVNSKFFDNNAFDTYSLLDPSLKGGIVDNSDPDKVLGGSFADYDNYMVNAQGVFGSMRPYYFERNIHKRNNFSKTDGGKDYTTVQYGATMYDDRAEFRFINDFSNRFESVSSEIKHRCFACQDPYVMSHTFGADEIKVGEEAADSYESNRVMQGSRNVAWFTNKDIVNQDTRVTDAGFIETHATGFDRGTVGNVPKADNIGGFTITNESGVKYHFALPAYAYGDYAFSEKIEGEETFNEFYKEDHYAYTWYLTAITGPDFIDRSAQGDEGDGILNEYDWGYWVEFEYGKWTDMYHWRNPGSGMDPDLDNEFQNFSEGRKEVYYLDAIRTKTHSALFFKDIRHDAKSANHYFRTDRYEEEDIYFGDNYLYTKKKTKRVLDDESKNGGFGNKPADCLCKKFYKTQIEVGPVEIDVTYKDEGTLNYTAKPTSSLKLNSVVLIKNNDLDAIALSKEHGIAYAQTDLLEWEVTSNDMEADKPNCDFSDIALNYHLYQNTLDIHDLAQVQTQITSHALKIINLETDYSLSPGTINSFDRNSQADLYGKLTLKKLKVLGKGGADVLPATKFKYEPDKPITGRAELTFYSGKFNFYLQNSGLTKGDLIRFHLNGRQRYGVIVSQSGMAHTLASLDDDLLEEGWIDFTETKNPPYDVDAFDSWGLFKSDYKGVPGSNISIHRLTTSVSKESLDVWSLRSITTPIGGKIKLDYEADEYNEIALASQQPFRIKDVVNRNNGKVELYVYEQEDLRDFMQVGQTIEVSLLNGYEREDRTSLVPEDQAAYDEDCPNGCNATLDKTYALPVVTEAVVTQVNSGSVVLEGLSDNITETKYVRKKLRYKPTGRPASALSNYGYFKIGFSGWPTAFVGGVLSAPKDTRYGGGIRVKSVAVTGLSGSAMTSYSYQNGTTSYEPLGILNPLYCESLPSGWDGREDDKDKKELKKLLVDVYSSLLANSREAPAPGVMYEIVQVREAYSSDATHQLPSMSEYQFEVFKNGLVGIDYSPITTSKNDLQEHENFVKFNKMQSRYVSIKDYTSRVGTLKRITLYDQAGNKLNETLNHYLHDGVEEEFAGTPYTGDDKVLRANDVIYEDRVSSQYNSQGVIHESFYESRFLDPDSAKHFILQGVLSRKEAYPAISTGQTVMNYKSGIQTQTWNLGYDFYSAQVTKTKSIDAYGNVFVNEVTPAYRVYPAMGQIAKNGKNMLIQQAASYAYKVNPQNVNEKVGLVSASVQTWSDGIPVIRPGGLLSEASAQTGIWRQHSAYTFVGEDHIPPGADGLYPAQDVVTFDEWLVESSQLAGWQQTSAITLYDVNSHGLEVRDLNDDYAATRMTLDNTKVMATIANAQYKEFAFSGAEEAPADGNFGNNVQHNSDVYTTQAHSGLKALVVQPNERAFTYTIHDVNARTYRVSFWASQANTSAQFILDGGPVEFANMKRLGAAGGWHLFEADITVPQAGGDIEVWCSAVDVQTNFDDFRIAPVDAAMTAYVYNEWDELQFILDNTNLYTKYVYDEGGRLKEVYRETLVSGIVKTTEHKYHYQSGK
ncbi:MAG TPA: hypothetical protein VGK59_19330 [Ohtaekwangia sp.]